MTFDEWWREASAGAVSDVNAHDCARIAFEAGQRSQRQLDEVALSATLESLKHSHDHSQCLMAAVEKRDCAILDMVAHVNKGHEIVADLSRSLLDQVQRRLGPEEVAVDRLIGTKVGDYVVIQTEEYLKILSKHPTQALGPMAMGSDAKYYECRIVPAAGIPLDP